MLSASSCARCESRCGTLSVFASESAMASSALITPCTVLFLISCGRQREAAVGACVNSVVAVQSAFLFFVLFPPPAAGALGLARRHRARAGRAADREEAAIVQLVVGNIVLADELEDALARPVQQRIDLEQMVGRIERGIRRHRAIDRLL